MIPELLAPAGSIESLQTAFHFGADSVYMGSRYSLRATNNQTAELERLARAVAITRELGKKIYITVNAFVYQHDLADLAVYLQEVAALQPDAIIVSDPAVIRLARERFPSIDLHLSTQANTLNASAVRFWLDQGIRRLVLGRELTILQLMDIRRQVPDAELEIFIHGALCLAFSGRCFLSHYLSGRSANQGRCSHPCRWNYTLREPKRDRDVMCIETSNGPTALLAPFDLMSLELLPELCALGMDAFKIEGRMKGSFYTGMVVHCYRKNLDRLARGLAIDRQDIDRLRYVTRRGYNTGFLSGKDSDHSHREYAPMEDVHAFIGIVDSVHTEGEKTFAKVRLRNKIHIQERVEILSPTGESMQFVSEMVTEEGSIDCGQPNQVVWFVWPDVRISAHDILYRV